MIIDFITCIFSAESKKETERAPNAQRETIKDRRRGSIFKTNLKPPSLCVGYCTMNVGKSDSKGNATEMKSSGTATGDTNKSGLIGIGCFLGLCVVIMTILLVFFGTRPGTDWWKNNASNTTLLFPSGSSFAFGTDALMVPGAEHRHSFQLQTPEHGVIELSFSMPDFHTWSGNRGFETLASFQGSNQPRFQGNNSTIFVSVPSYRDPECVYTVCDLFLKAKRPERIYVGVCQQLDSGEGDLKNPKMNVLVGFASCLSSLAGPLKAHRYRKFIDQVRVCQVSAHQAKGPTLARHWIESYLYNGEQYYLMTDSHMLFCRGWDEKAIQLLKCCPSVKPVLTMYPAGFESKDRWVPPLWQQTFLQGRRAGSYLRWKAWDTDTELPTFEGPSFPTTPRRTTATDQKDGCPYHMYKSLFWASGFSFTLGSVISEVPYDAHAWYVFYGEEITMAARLWTHGWDFFSPPIMLALHIWSRSYRPTFWEQLYPSLKRHATKDAQENQEMLKRQKESIERIRGMLWAEGTTSSPKNSSFTRHSSRRHFDQKYALGTQRTLNQYQEFCGIRFREKAVQEWAKLGCSAPLQDTELQHKGYQKST